MLLVKWTLEPLRRQISHHRFNLRGINYDTEYLLNRENAPAIEANIRQRKGVGDIRLIHELNEQLHMVDESQAEHHSIAGRLQSEMEKIPNRTHPDVASYGNVPKLMKRYNQPYDTDCRKYYEFGDMCKKMNFYRMENLGNFTGHRSYYLTDELAELEHALITYTIQRLLKQNFRLISVPDILPAGIIESCGMNTSGDRNQVYKVKHERETLCLSGTSEMALAGYFAGQLLRTKQVPLRLAAVSRCFRAESSALHEEKGIYRVHQFTKVEMFAICAPDQSASMLDEFQELEVSLFDELGLPFKVLDMPASELGAPAYRKYDIEAWMPGRAMYGEISSCSDCTDFQSRRLGIRIEPPLQFAHTVNGTACAVPRMLIALLENFQNEDHTVSVPVPLRKYISGKHRLCRRKVLPELKLTKRLQQEDVMGFTSKL
ncbi:serine--tRNA ligase, mitochondrial [Anopheles bellator]|uniref:serine--tRNA ligase, mitochondrial n=1 Tax=Anopheles bellator TaxID=139047 RepID=UPI002647536A|nr:serine--tRNA ligase, mitochondrial [Anopheles bellator]